MKKLLALLLVLILAGGGAYAYWYRSAGTNLAFRTVPVTRGDLLVTISATGTVEPEEVVDVGAQVAGKIEAFGEDPRRNGRVIDYGSPVEVGTVLARIESSLYAADVAQAAAQSDSAKANVQRAEADLRQLKAKLIQSERDWKRAKDLGPSRALSATEYDSYEAAYETAKASVGVGEAALVQAQKDVVRAEAALRRVETNLGYCTIRSPVKGVIIDRRVNIGQTVVASLNAPSLFLIAKDLRRMQVWAAVNEVDIGNIHAGQPVTFTIDAYPNETFRGEVGKVRLNASMTQNVVTYTVEINTDNSSGKLLPYLTANVQFHVAQRDGVLLVPNAALRWKPSPELVAPDAQETSPASQSQEASVPHPSASQPAARTGTIWVQDRQYVRPIAVNTGLSDNTLTEIEADKLAEHTPVIIGQLAKGEVSDTTTSPFTPRLIRGGRRGP
jgi:HlyD family secretion protein